MLSNYWQKACRIGEAAREIGTDSVRKIAQATGVSKSAAHRHMKAKLSRNQHPESALWESSCAQLWLVRLVSATILHFGIQRGVGAETISQFFKDLRIGTHVGVSPTAIRSQRLRIEQLIIQYGKQYQEEGITNCDQLEIIGGVDETFFKEIMILLAMDLRTGYILSEKTSEHRKYDTWKEQLESAFDKMPIKVRYLVSDRAPALIKLATKHFECKSIADLFHATHKIAQTFSLPLHNKVSATLKQLEKIDQEIVQLAVTAKTDLARQKLEEQRKQTKSTLLLAQVAQRQYREALHQFSLIVHPFRTEITNAEASILKSNTPVSLASTQASIIPTAAPTASTAPTTDPITSTATTTDSIASTAATAAPMAPTRLSVSATATPMARTAAPMATIVEAPTVTPTAALMASTRLVEATTVALMTPTASPMASTRLVEAATVARMMPTAVPMASTRLVEAATVARMMPTAAPMASTRLVEAATVAPMRPTAAPMASTQFVEAATADPVARTVASMAAIVETTTAAPIARTAALMTSTQVSTTLSAIQIETVHTNEWVSVRQSSEYVEKQLKQVVKNLQVLASKHELNYEKKLKSVKNQLPDLACLMDVWWEWVDNSLVEVVSDPIIQQWAKNKLLAKVYWQKQIGKSTNKEIDKVYQNAYQKACSNLELDPLTAIVEAKMRQKLEKWAQLMVSRFCRTTSAVEGRNGSLSQLNHCRRGFCGSQLAVLTVLHNFQIKRADGTTAAERFFDQQFPDLFEWFLPQVQSLPRPRASRL